MVSNKAKGRIDVLPEPPIQAVLEAGSEGNVRAVERALAILNAFSADQPFMGVAQIQKKTGLSRATVYRLLTTLSAARLVRSEGDPQRFTLDHGVMKFASVWLSTLDAVELARPILRELRETLGETTALFLLRENSRICAVEYKSREAISYSRGLGHAGDITQGATGKAILAAMQDDQVTNVLDTLGCHGLARSKLLEAVGETRRAGYAISFSEIIEGALAISVAFRDHRGDVAGSLGLFGPQPRFPETKIKRCANALMQASEALSSQLGFEPT